MNTITTTKTAPDFGSRSEPSRERLPNSAHTRIKRSFKQLLSKTQVLKQHSQSKPDLKSKSKFLPTKPALLAHQPEAHSMLTQTKPEPDNQALNLAITKISVIDHINNHMAEINQFRAANSVEDINRLIKKMALSFSAKKSESSFLVGEGIFAGAHFKLHCQDNNLALHISSCQSSAAKLLRQHQGYLAFELKKHQINLAGLRFIDI